MRLPATPDRARPRTDGWIADRIDDTRALAAALTQTDPFVLGQGRLTEREQRDGSEVLIALQRWPAALAARDQRAHHTGLDVIAAEL